MPKSGNCKHNFCQLVLSFLNCHKVEDSRNLACANTKRTGTENSGKHTVSCSGCVTPFLSLLVEAFFPFPAVLTCSVDVPTVVVTKQYSTEP